MVAKVRDHVARTRRSVVIDFTPTETMFPCGTLFFMAEMDRICRLLNAQGVIRCVYPRQLIVEQVLQQVGMMKMLGMRERRLPSAFPENVRHWRYETGKKADGAVAEPVLSRYELLLAAGKLPKDSAESLRSGLYAGIVEAMTNSAQHAYEGTLASNRPGGLIDGWWMFSQEKDGQLTVAVCDLGIGIPSSLRQESIERSEPARRKIMAALGLGSTHADLIKTATELPKTRTGERHRGKGLGDVLDVVRRAGAGHLRILSGRGAFRYDGASRKETLRDYPQDILGTFIQWTLPLPERVE